MIKPLAMLLEPVCNKKDQVASAPSYQPAHLCTSTSLIRVVDVRSICSNYIQGKAGPYLGETVFKYFSVFEFAIFLIKKKSNLHQQLSWFPPQTC